MHARLLPLASLLAAAALPAHADDLTLRRVMLSTGGVGYFEYEAQADGPVTLGLDVPLGLVDDVLKSLVVFDAAGSVGGVELPGQDAGQAAFADVPFGPHALGSPLDYLNSLQGVVLEVKGPRSMTGRLLRAERVREPAPVAAAGAPPAAPDAGLRTRVTLLTDVGLQQFVLEEADSVQVADVALRERIGRALEALRGAAAHEARHLTLRGAGQGERTVRVGYVAGAPLWKTTYRLLLPPPEGGKARLQGWAVLENASGADWNGVELSLQYGNPVTFRQALYRAYYVQRPEVPVEVLGRILPGVDTGAHAMPMAGAAGAAAPAAAAAPAPAPMMAMRSMAKSAPAAMQMAEPEEQAAAAEAADATLFKLASPLVLPAGHSATVPILDKQVPADRIGVVQQGRPHPLQALRIKNDTGTSLPAGVLTLYDPSAEASFAGDARLAGLPNGQDRLLEFAEDLRTSVDWQNDESNALLTVTAAQGVLRLQQRERWAARVTLTAPADEPRHLLLEIPRRPEATLQSDDDIKPVTETATAWRLPVTLKAGETRTVIANVDRITFEESSLLEDNGVLATVLGNPALSASARSALRHVADLRAALSAKEAERDKLKAQIEEVGHDEDRVRQNLAALPPTDALHGKLVRALDADEDRIASLTAGIAQAETLAAQARTALEQAVATLRLER
jgi:hypothetical protein